MEVRFLEIFQNNNIVNKNIVISISVIIIIAIIAYSLTQIATIEEENTSYLKDSEEIAGMLEKIKQDKIKNDNSDDPYKPKDREWIQSGPFLIDRSEYVLGEKIFVNVGNLPENVKGEIRFEKIFNSTHNHKYKALKFDSSKPQSNFYLSIYPSIPKGFCTSESLVGEWEVIFDGTPFEKLKFKIIDKMIPGMENQFRPLC